MKKLKVFCLLSFVFCFLAACSAPSNYIRVRRLDASGSAVAAAALATGFSVEIEGNLNGLDVKCENSGPCSIKYKAPGK